MSALAAPSVQRNSPASAAADSVWRADPVSRPDESVRALTDANEALQQQKAVADALLAQSAADLATPMSLILGYLQLMDAHPKLRALFERDADARALRDGMGNTITRMQAVMNDLSLYARVLSGRLELTVGRVRLAEVLARALSAYAEPMRQRAISLRFERVRHPECNGRRRTAD